MSRAVCLLILSFALSGQEPPPAGAPVIVDGKTVLRVKADLGAFTAASRAAGVQQRIMELGDSTPAKPIAIDIQEEAGILVISAAGQRIMAVTDLDARAENMTPRQVAMVYAESIRRAVDEYRQVHSWSSILIGIAKATAAWIVFLLIAWLAKRGFDLVSRRIKEWFTGKVDTKGTRGLFALLWEKLLLFVLTLMKLAAFLFLLVQLSVLLTYTFSIFPATQGLSFSVLDNILGTLSGIGRALVDYMPRGFFVLVVGWLAYYILQIGKSVFRAIERGDVHFESLSPDMAPMTYQLFRAGLLIFVLIIVFPYLPGSQSDAFKGVSIFVGVLISFGSGSAISNVLAGIVLTYMRAYKVGDRVKVGEHMGDVIERGMLVMRLKTIKNVEVTIPNSSILGSQILNYSANARGLGLILHTTVTIGYDAPWRKVHEIMIEAARNTNGILADPPPFVLQTSLNDFHISYEINAFTNRPIDMVDIYSELHANIQESFNKSGVEIMSPTFLALRDGNTVTTPEAHRPGDYDAPSFRVKQTGESG